MEAYLLRLGVTEQDQMQMPTEKLPSAFNPSLQKEWSNIVNNNNSTDVEQSWAMCVTKLLEASTMSGIYPFTFDQAQVNESILNQLIDAYNSIVSYTTSQPFFFMSCSGLRSSSVAFVDSTFIVHHQFGILLETEQILEFISKEAYVNQPNVIHIFDKQLSDKVKLSIDITSKTFSYEITCNQLPIIADKYFVSNEELEAFILKILCRTACSMINIYNNSFSKFFKF